MERLLFGYALGDFDTESDQEGDIDDVDEVAERRGTMPKRGDGGWVSL
jgi:hypothetical protein